VVSGLYQQVICLRAELAGQTATEQYFRGSTEAAQQAFKACWAVFFLAPVVVALQMLCPPPLVSPPLRVPQHFGSANAVSPPHRMLFPHAIERCCVPDCELRGFAAADNDIPAMDHSELDRRVWSGGAHDCSSKFHRQNAKNPQVLRTLTTINQCRERRNSVYPVLALKSFSRGQGQEDGCG
jgi:hypothetical protein